MKPTGRNIAAGHRRSPGRRLGAGISLGVLAGLGDLGKTTHDRQPGIGIALDR